MTIPSQFIDESKRLLRDQLAQHSDPGIRLLNEVAELADDNPSVLRVAAALQAQAKRS